MKKILLLTSLLGALFTLPLTSLYVHAEDSGVENEQMQGDEPNYDENYSDYDENGTASDEESSDEEMSQEQE